MCLQIGAHGDAEDTPEDGHAAMHGAGQSVADELSSLILQSFNSSYNVNPESPGPPADTRPVGVF